MKSINPRPGIIYIKTEEVKAGMLDTSAKDTAIEYAVVLAVGDGVEGIKEGDRIFVKAWSIDVITHEGERYCFVHADTQGILAIVKK